MTFSDWAADTAARFREHSFRFATKRSGQELLMGALRRAPSPAGNPVWEREWDVLLILDACRWDVFSEHYGDADWLNCVEATTSIGSASPEWMNKTFTTEYEDELASTAYVTGNPYSEDHVSENQLALLDEVWRYVWDDDLGTILPEPLTNQAVKHWRTGDYDHMIVHYMQPHWPYVTDPIMYGFNPDHITTDGSTQNPFDQQNRGELSRDNHMERYAANLDYIMNHIQKELVTGINAETVALTADHATLFGEYGLYKHPANIPLSKLRRVPWAVTSATDTGEFEIDDLHDNRQSLDIDQEEQLQDLGYV